MPTAIGFSDHSGWAVAAVVSREGNSFELLLRRRIQICPTHLPRQAYHAVAEQGAPRSTVLEVVEASVAMAKDAIAALLREADGEAHAAGVARGRTSIPTDIDRILRAHTLLHAAEGELYRDVLVEAAAANNLRIVRFLNKEVRSEAAAAVGWSLGQLEDYLALTGKAVGSPWTTDEKDATAAAMLALAVVGPVNA